MTENKMILLNYSGLGPVSMAIGERAGAIAVIKPGPNEIKSDIWEQLKKQPDVKEMIKRGESDPKGLRNSFKSDPVGNISFPGAAKKEKSGEQGSSEITPVSSLSELNAVDAKSLVKQTQDTELLRKWADEETRQGVSGSIERKLADIEAERANSSE